MQRHIELEYEKLRNRVIQMGSMVDEQVMNAIKAFLSGDKEKAKEIIEKENLIDNLDVKIDKQCQKIFALSQPVASDLRFIMSSLKIDNDLERIGDIAVSIARKIENISYENEIIESVGMERYALQVQKMIKEAIDCFINKDVSIALELLQIGPELSDTSQIIFDNILKNMLNDSSIIISASNLILVLRQLERLKDHAENIAEDVIFMVNGKIVKHSRGLKEE